MNNNVRYNPVFAMPLSCLEVMQDGLRTPGQIGPMVSYIKRGGLFTADKVYDTIEIAEFPDGRKFIHDGLHRCLSILLAGKHYLLPSEYHTKKWDYEYYNTVRLFNDDGSWRGYITPFDPRYESRLPDFKEFKEYIRELAHYSVYMSDDYEAEEIERIIRESHHEYRVPKRFYNLEDMRKEYGHLIKRKLSLV